MTAILIDSMNRKHAVGEVAKDATAGLAAPMRVLVCNPFT
jgi:hypothetical protein